MNDESVPVKVLIVEDDPSVIQLLSRWLGAEGCLVHSAGSAEEAIAIAGDERMDVILTDLCLPGISGFAALPDLKGKMNTPVFVMTGYADDGLLTDALCFGAAGLIAKPFEREKLLSIVRGASGRAASPRPC